MVFTPCYPEVVYGGAQDRTGLLVGADDPALVAVSTALFPGTWSHRPDDFDRWASRVRLGDRDAASGSMEWRTGPVQSDLDPGDYRPAPERVAGTERRDHPPGPPGWQSPLLLPQALPGRA